MNGFQKFIGAVVLLATVTGCQQTRPAPSGSEPTTATTSTATKATATGLVGCEPAPVLMLVVGVHQATGTPQVPVQLQCLLTATLTSGGAIGVVAIDGTPELLLSPTRFTLSSANSDARSDDIQQSLGQVLGSVRRATADSNGSDALAAIALGLNAARAAEPGTQPLSRPEVRLEVLDSGLSDTGALQMTARGMTAADPSAVATFLHDEKALPDGRDARIDLWGFGYATAPQRALNPVQYANVVAIWLAVLRKAGADARDIPLPPAGQGPSTRFTVHLVPTIGLPQPGACRLLVLDDSSPVGFLPDSTTFRDPPAAAGALRPLAAWLGADATRRATVTGTTASAGTARGRKALALGRADAVKEDLVQGGARPSQVLTTGAGYTHRPPDRLPNGALDPVKAALNRTVRIQTSC